MSHLTWLFYCAKMVFQGLLFKIQIKKGGSDMRPWVVLMIFPFFFSGVGVAVATPIEILDANGCKVFRQGPEIFQTYELKAQVIGNSVIVLIWTNYPPTLMPADLFFKKDGRITMAVKMGDGRIIAYPEILTRYFSRKRDSRRAMWIVHIFLSKLVEGVLF